MPTAAQIARRRDPGQYRLSDGTESPAPEQPHLTFICPVCHALMYAAEDQVGQELSCPDCDTPVVVPPPVRPREKIKPPPSEIEAYALCDEVEGTAVGPRAAELSYVPFTCPVCNTFMQLPRDQVGRPVTCPDCGVSTMVTLSLARHRREAGPRAGLGEYALCDEDRGPPRPPAVEQSGFPLHCPLCDSLIYARRDQVGRQIVCDDCQASFVVPRPASPKRKPDLSAHAEEVYAVQDPVEAPGQRPGGLLPPLPARPGAGRAAGRDGVAPVPSSCPPPRWTFFSGVFTFPLYRSSLPSWFGLSIGLAPGLWLGWLAVSLGMRPAGPWLGAIPWLMSMVLCAAAAVLGIIWIIAAFSYGLSILRDTSYGYHQVENWPDPVFLDWIGEVFFLLVSLALSALPGVLIAGGLDSAGIPGWPAVPVCLLLLLPVNLLATLETNSPLNPISLPVWRTLLTAWWAWGLFYVETTLLIAAGGLLAGLAAVYVPFAGIVLAAPVLVATLMIYFRLLGRLVWHCGKEPLAAAIPADGTETEDRAEDPP